MRAKKSNDIVDEKFLGKAYLAVSMSNLTVILLRIVMYGIESEVRHAHLIFNTGEQNRKRKLVLSGISGPEDAQQSVWTMGERSGFAKSVRIIRGLFKMPPDSVKQNRIARKLLELHKSGLRKVRRAIRGQQAMRYSPASARSFLNTSAAGTPVPPVCSSSCSACHTSTGSSTGKPDRRPALAFF